MKRRIRMGLLAFFVFACLHSGAAWAEPISVLTYNIWGLTIGGKAPWRFEEIGRRLERYEIVTIQEAWDKKTEALVSAAGFPHVARGKKPNSMVGGAGLITLSRHPVLESEFLEYRACAGMDCFADKGALRTRVVFPDGYALDVYNTHLNAWMKVGVDFGAKAREKEIVELAGWIRERSAGVPYLVMGDFNAVESSENYRQMRASFGALDVFRSFRPHDLGETWDPANSWVADFLKPMRVDYIWASGLGEGDVADSVMEFTAPVRDGKHLSDHYGLSAVIERPR
jgi:endonuclease/exonuclease/phosphatase family metal-dependent hydrolase